jgi:hypothetical protein
VVWLHGPHGIRGRDPVIAELAKRHTVVAPLAPGFADLAELSRVGLIGARRDGRNVNLRTKNAS